MNRPLGSTVARTARSRAHVSASKADSVAVACSDNGDEAFAAADRKADGQQMTENKPRCGDQDAPQELVAEIGAQDRVGRDARGIVVGKAGEHARSDYGGQDRQACGSAAPVVRKASRDSSPLVADLWLTITHYASVPSSGSPTKR